MRGVLRHQPRYEMKPASNNPLSNFLSSLQIYDMRSPLIVDHRYKSPLSLLNNKTRLGALWQWNQNSTQKSYSTWAGGKLFIKPGYGDKATLSISWKNHLILPPLSDNNTDYFACTEEEVMAGTGELVMMERSSIDNFTLGPFTINSEQYARQLVNLSESDLSSNLLTSVHQILFLVLEWAAFVVHQVLIQLIF